MARSKSDIANSAIRIFLQKVGVFYDNARGFEKFIPNKKQKEELLKYFNHQCCFCDAEITLKSLSQDHLVPMNKAGLGLHAWGNVVPCCQTCNNEKNQKDWVEFLGLKAHGKVYKDRLNTIRAFVKEKNYEPNLHLDEYAGNLYEDVGEVAMTLIGLRLKQAEEAIEKILKK